jgi:hypothetical protein
MGAHELGAAVAAVHAAPPAAKAVAEAEATASAPAEPDPLSQRGVRSVLEAALNSLREECGLQLSSRQLVGAMRALLAHQTSWEELGLPKLILAYNVSSTLPAAFRGAVARLGKACPVREMLPSLVSPVQPPYNLLKMGGFVQQDAAKLLAALGTDPATVVAAAAAAKAKAAPKPSEAAAPAEAPAAPAVARSKRVVLRELSSAEFGLVCGKGGAHLKAIAKAHAVRAQARRPHVHRSVAAPA